MQMKLTYLEAEFWNPTELFLHHTIPEKEQPLTSQWCTTTMWTVLLLYTLQ